RFLICRIFYDEPASTSSENAWASALRDEDRERAHVLAVVIAVKIHRTDGDDGVLLLVLDHAVEFITDVPAAEDFTIGVLEEGGDHFVGGALHQVVAMLEGIGALRAGDRIQHPDLIARHLRPPGESCTPATLL